MVEHLSCLVLLVGALANELPRVVLPVLVGIRLR